MSTDLTISEGKLPILMKSGLVHWVTPELHAKLQTHLSSQAAHSFMTIKELECTINTAEIEAVYTLSQYADYGRAKQGMWQCEFRNWHGKKGECDCRAEWRKKENERRTAKEKLTDYAPLSKEQRALAATFIDNINRERPIVGRKFGKVLKRSALNDYEKKFGRPYEVPAGMRVEEDAGALVT